MTYEIVLCDDDLEQLGRIEEWLELYRCEKNPHIQYRIIRFQNAEEMLIWFDEEKNLPDLLLLDIFMPGKTGIDAAEELRKDNRHVPIVFLTTSKEYALSAYEVDAIQYLVKQLEREKFYHVMDISMELIGKRQEKSIVFKVGNSYRRLMQDEIIYCESERNYQIVHLADEVLKIRITAKEMFERLQRFSQFIRCGTSYIINMNHIVKVDKCEIFMDNSSSVFIPKNRGTEFKKKYFEYYFSEE